MIFSTVKFLKKNLLSFYHRVMHSKDADRMANCVDYDQTAWQTL